MINFCSCLEKEDGEEKEEKVQLFELSQHGVRHIADKPNVGALDKTEEEEKLHLSVSGFRAEAASLRVHIR